MSNSYFRFKQFIIHQDRCAMKVSTDACIAGAWTEVPRNAKRVLDIGTGTGLLALMLAQKYQDIIIDAIELDEEAAMQAAENVKVSPWSDRINIIHADASQYNFAHKYDFIITNPPFFNNSLLGDSTQRNMARHTHTLSYAAIFDIIRNNLNDSGRASILLPATEHELWEKMAVAQEWQAADKLYIHPGEGKPANRVVAIYAMGHNNSCTQEHLNIRNAERDYTDEFNSLMLPYYLDK